MGTVSSPKYSFFLGKLDKAFNQYFVHIFSLDRRSCFMIKLHGSMGPYQGEICDPCICSQTPFCSQKLPTVLHDSIDLQFISVVGVA